MAVPSYGLIVDPKYIYTFVKARSELYNISNIVQVTSALWEQPHHRYIGLTLR